MYTDNSKPTQHTPDTAAAFDAAFAAALQARITGTPANTPEAAKEGLQVKRRGAGCFEICFKR